MKRTEPLKLSEIINNALRESHLDTAMLEHKASYVWPEVMGQGINRYTSRRWVDRGVLHVVITSGPLKNELSFHKTRIVKAINEAVGADIITSIVIH